MAKKVSKKTQRKIDHLREVLATGEKKYKVAQKGLHHMKMKPEDVQTAIQGNIYG
jgi:hypothetical protein